MNSDTIQIYVAFGIARNDAGKLLADYDGATRHSDAKAACAAAERMATISPYIAGCAFTRTVNLISGECSRTVVLQSFGDLAAREHWSN